MLQGDNIDNSMEESPSLLSGHAGTALGEVQEIQGRRLPKEFFPFRGECNRQWARDWYSHRYLLNNSAVRMYQTNEELDAFAKEGKDAIKKIKEVAWKHFQNVTLNLIRERPAWKIVGEGKQPPTSLTEVANILATEKWISSVPKDISEEALGVLAVGLFIERSTVADWVKSAEMEALAGLGVLGYDENIKGKATLSKIIKQAASEKWKKSLSEKMTRNLGWSVGSRKEKKSDEVRYETMATKGGYVVYKVFRLDGYGKIDETRQDIVADIRKWVRVFIRIGGEVDEIKDIVAKEAEKGKSWDRMDKI